MGVKGNVAVGVGQFAIDASIQLGVTSGHMYIKERQSVVLLHLNGELDIRVSMWPDHKCVVDIPEAKLWG